MKRRPALLAAVVLALLGAGSAAAESQNASVKTVHIVGRVTDASSGAGVVGMCVHARSTAGVTTVTTAADGSYRINMWQRPGSARDYNVDADAHCGAGSWWLRTGYPRPVTLNTIPGHATAYGINMATVRGGRVIGQLTDDASGAPVAGATVYVSDADVGAAHGSAVSQPDGTFTIGGLKAGQYVVEVYAAGYIPERVHHMSLATAPATGQLVTVTVGQSSVADETLLRSNTINGTVTNAETGAPLPFIDVYAIPISSTPWPTQQVVLTNNDGTFSLTGLGPATYHICFRDGDLTTVFESACWHDEPWGGGTALTVDGYGIVLNDVDQALHPGAG